MEDIVPGESSTIKLSKQLMKLQFQETTDKLLSLSPIALSTKLQICYSLTIPKESSCQQYHPNVAESKIIGVNYLGFAKSLFQQYSQQLGLNSNYYLTESAFNYYINNKITDCLRGTVNIDFTPIITEINQTIERYMQQQFPITYADKGKRKIQTPTATLKGIQVESLTAPSYHYIPEKLSEEEEEGSEDQGFTYQNPISENSEFRTLNVQTPQNPNIKNLEIETPNIRTQQNQKNQNFDLINQPNIPPNIVIDHPPIDPIVKPIQQTTLAIITATTTAIAATTTTKRKPNGLRIHHQDDTRALQAISYFLKEITDFWYQSLAARPQTFQQFKTAFLGYFSNNNSINCLANTFTTIKQNSTEAVTTYLGRFHRILNQFICGLCSSILQHVRPLHPANLQVTVTHTRDFESAELEANHANSIGKPSDKIPSDYYRHQSLCVPNYKFVIYSTSQRITCNNAQAVNLVMNGSFDLDSKLKQIRKHELFLKSVTSNVIIQLAVAARNMCLPQLKSTSKSRLPISNPESISKSRAKSKHLPANDVAANLSSISISNSSLSTAATSNISTTAIHNISTAATIVYQLIFSFFNSLLGLHSWNLSTSATQNPNSQNYLSLLVTLKDATPSNLETNPIQKLTSNIPPAMVTKNETLAAIFPFEFEKTTPVLLFSRAALEEKPITAMYTNAKVDSHSIKLILDNGSAGIDCAASACIITADGATKTPIGKINDFPFEINNIIIPIKVLVMEVTQYQALHTQTPVICGHFKPSNTQPLIEFEEKTKKPTWEAYQVLWADQDHNELSPQKETELTWTSDQAWKTKNDYNEPEDNRKGKGKETILEETISTSKITSNSYSVHEPLSQPPYILLKCKDCEKKLSSMGAWINNKPCLTCSEQLLDEGIWNNIPGRGETCDTLCQYTIFISNWVSHGIPITAAWHQALDHLDGYSHNKEEIWQMANAKVEGATPSEILKIKNNSPELVNIICILNPDAFMDKKTGPEDFHKYYQNLASTKEEQEQRCYWRFLCDLIYNSLSHIIYMIPEEIKPISSCVFELESPFNSNSNFDNDNDKNTGSSSVQIDNNNDNNSNSDSNSDPKYEQYIALPDLFKEQELK
ncbi:hypothetical protein G9A89_004820 [Geosiphon pyriformis]|nr:hypothetical protein G9A89_004820 [Geosiphon pyriformis]